MTPVASTTGTLKVGLFVRLEAKPGKEDDVLAFLRQGLQMANQEATTPLWFALRLGPTTFAIFDSFADESARKAHLKGPIADALMAQAPTLLSAPPTIESVDVIGAKDLRVIDMKTDMRTKTGVFAVTTTKATDPARYDLYVSGRLRTDEGDEIIFSRPIPFEVTGGPLSAK